MQIIKIICSKIKSFLIRLFCFMTFFFIALSKKQNQKVFICASPLGDTCYALSFRSYLLNNYKCKFYFSESCRTLIECCYKDIVNNSEIVYYKKNTCLFYAIKKSLGCIWQNFIFSKFNIRIIYPDAYLKDIIEYDYFTILKNFIYPNLPPLTKIEYPKVPSVPIISVENFDNIKNKIIVINPYSVSMPNDTEILWEGIANYFIQKGFIVFTNVMRGQKEISGTRRLDCSIIELYNICDNIPMFISVRSGIVDFTISSSCHKIVVWFNNGTPADISMYNICKLDLWGRINVSTITYSNISDTLESVKCEIEKFNIL